MKLFSDGSMQDQDIWMSPSGVVLLHQGMRYLTWTLPLHLKERAKRMLEWKSTSTPDSWILPPSSSSPLIYKSFKIETIRWELVWKGRQVTSIDKLVRISLHPNNQRFSVSFPIRMLDGIEEKFVYQLVEQNYSIWNCPSYWMFPLSQLLLDTLDPNVIEIANIYGKKSNYIKTDLYYTTCFPTLDPMKLKPTHQENSSFLPGFNGIVRRWLKEDIVYEAIEMQEGVQIECIYPDGSLFRSDSDFHFISYYGPSSPMESLYHINSNLESITHHSTDVTYPLRKIVSDCLFMYQKFHSNQSTHCDKRRTWEVVQPQVGQVVRRLVRDGVGEFVFMSHGIIKGKFIDRVVVEIPFDINEYSVARIIDSKGCEHQVRVLYPLGFEEYMDVMRNCCLPSVDEENRHVNGYKIPIQQNDPHWITSLIKKSRDMEQKLIKSIDS
jgi:hypothetical protein